MATISYCFIVMYCELLTANNMNYSTIISKFENSLKGRNTPILLNISFCVSWNKGSVEGEQITYFLCELSY